MVRFASINILASIKTLLGVMSLLRPLLLDVVPTVQQTAALALGRLANYNDDLAEAVVKGDILPQLVYSLAEQNVSLFMDYWYDVEYLAASWINFMSIIFSTL